MLAVEDHLYLADNTERSYFCTQLKRTLSGVLRDILTTDGFR
jgi:hypothetical protein